VAGDFESRFREALRRRLYPHAPLHLKQIARAIGRSENTVARWWRGETRILADDLYRLAEFIVGRGDRKFLQEIFFDLLPSDAPSDDMAALVLTLVRGALVTSNREGGIDRDTHRWFIADGEMAEAPTGHADYVRSVLRLPGTAGDLAAYAMRTLGWIAATERADGVLVIRHDGRRVAPLAAERICEWLADHAEQIAHVRRSVGMNGHWIEAYHHGAHAAATAITKVAFIVHVPRRAWMVRPLPLDSVADPRLSALLRVHRQEPEQLVRAAAAMGAFTTSSLFGVRGEDVVSQYVGSDLGFDPRAVEGLNVLSRPDTEYALMLQARILRTQREGATYHELSGTIDAYNVRYLNLTLPEPGANGRVLTSSVVLEREHLAA
jgi:transcriptional regulator with XRE-family HTH domain